jgi:hypothetical protein
VRQSGLKTRSAEISAQANREPLMPYRKSRKPTLRLKIVNGRRYAVVTLSDAAGKRRDIFLGNYGTDEADRLSRLERHQRRCSESPNGSSEQRTL